MERCLVTTAGDSSACCGAHGSLRTARVVWEPAEPDLARRSRCAATRGRRAVSPGVSLVGSSRGLSRVPQKSKFKQAGHL